MDQIELLTRQTEDAYAWTNKLLDTIPYDQWERIPEVVESSVQWQVGHLIMSFYYHSVMVVSGHQMDILQKIPMKEYDQYFTTAAPTQSIGKISPERLHQQLLLVEQKSLEILRSLSSRDLPNKLEPTPVPHPIATTKWEALDWNIKHTMWHCGQLGILKRILNERYDFGLKRTD